MKNKKNANEQKTRTTDSSPSIEPSVPVQPFTVQNSLPAEVQEEARLLRSQGASLSQIGKQLGISKSAAWNLTKDVEPQQTPKDVVSSEPLEGMDDLSRLDEMFKKPRHRGYLDYERLLRSQGPERSSRIKEIVNDAIETRIYLDVLGIDLSKNPSKDDGAGLSFDNMLKWRLLSQGENKGAEGKIFDLYMDAQSRLYEILLKRTEGRDITTEVNSLKQTLDAVQTVVQMLPKKESDAWAKAFSSLVDKVAPDLKSFLSGLGEILKPRMQAHTEPPPPPQTMPPNEVELAERTGIREQLPKLQQQASETTFAEEGLPEEEETQPEPTTTEEQGGSVSEVEKRLRRSEKPE